MLRYVEQEVSEVKEHFKNTEARLQREKVCAHNRAQDLPLKPLDRYLDVLQGCSCC